MADPITCPHCGGTGTVMFGGVPGVVHAKPMVCGCRVAEVLTELTTTHRAALELLASLPPEDRTNG